MSRVRNIARGLYWWSVQFGIDPRKTLRAIGELPRFVSEYRHFRRSYQGALQVRASLHDRTAAAGATSDEYFWQDLYVARLVHDAKPERHVDVGSRIDGFVAHVAAFRDIEVIDIRPMPDSIPGVQFRQADLMMPSGALTNYCDSLSCLHALEHFGLGRYGDPLDPRGHEVGFANLASMLRPEGVLYLSLPVGVERVEYNSHRVLNPFSVLGLAGQWGLRLVHLAWVGPDGCLRESADHEPALQALAAGQYALGIFVLRKS